VPLRSQMDVAKRQKASFRERDFTGLGEDSVAMT